MRSSLHPLVAYYGTLFCEMSPLFLLFFSALATLLAVGCGDRRIAARKTFYVGGPKRRRSGEARVAKTSVVTAVAGLEMQPAAKCLVDFASDCKSL